jgi:hypothetical protein
MISTVSDRGARCPQCRSRAAIQSTIELTPGINYLTLRCISCAVIYDAQVPANPALATALVRRIECGA